MCLCSFSVKSNQNGKIPVPRQLLKCLVYSSNYTLWQSPKKAFFWMGVSFILKAKVTVSVIGFPPAYSFVSKRSQSLSLLSFYSGDEVFLLVVRKQTAEMTCKGVRSTAYGRCSAKAPHPSLAFLVKIVKILRGRLWKRHGFWSGWDWMQS